MDTQTLELVGRHRLIEDLMGSGLEVAMPVRDCGVDLIAYAGAVVGGVESGQRFFAHPLQLKAARGEAFTIARKYAKFDALVLVYAWNVAERGSADDTDTQRGGGPVFLAMTYREAVAVACDMGYTQTQSWVKDGLYSVTSVPERLRTRLEPMVVEPGGWPRAMKLWSLDAVACAEAAERGDGDASGLLKPWLARHGIPFNPGDDVPGWPEWQDEAAAAMRDGAAFTCGDRQTLRRLLTVHVRKERFCEGHWDESVESGHVTALVRSLVAAPIE
jgi:hypothetical protein